MKRGIVLYSLRGETLGGLAAPLNLVKGRYESGAMANAAVDMGHLERRVHALVAQADGHLRNVGG